MHPALAAVRDAISGTPFEGQVWLVGGAVRDELLGNTPNEDFDLVTELSSHDLASLLFQCGAADHPPVTYPRFGTAMVSVNGVAIEVVTARRESYHADSRKPDVEPASLEEDAARRDFTCNTLLRNVTTGELRDPLGTGLADLRASVLRTPLEPGATFSDDPLRMLRAVRFRWKLGFAPAPGLYEAIRSHAHRLQIVSEERIRDEFLKMLLIESAADALQDLLDLELLIQFAPELAELVGVEQGHFHHLDAWRHTLVVVSQTRPEPILRLAALLHDIGKPQTRMIDRDGRIRFFGHEVQGEDITRALMRRLKFSGDEVDAVARLVRNHMRLGSMPTFTDSAARRLLRDLGDDADTLLDLVEADAKGLKAGVRRLDLGPIRETLARVRLATPPEKLDSPLDGGEIMREVGLPAGPAIGAAKAYLTELVLDGRLQPDDKAAAIVALREFARNLDS